MIDLRSDTFTQPTPAMRQAMAMAEVGDDVFGEDPTVNRLEARVAELLGKEAALFVPSGTMGNQIGIRLHAGPGDEFICDLHAHVYQYEQAAFAQLFGISVRTIDAPGGMLCPQEVEEHLRPDSIHSPRTTLVCLENTHNRRGGRVLPQDRVEELCAWAADRGLARHLDGARLWNAAAATGVPPADLVRCFDTVSVCFSKGLGAPVGSALCGSRDHIARARRLRKALGGGMRQAGVLAAAALHALDCHLERLADDHAGAQKLAAAVREAPNLGLIEYGCDTNIVVAEVAPALGSASELCAALRERGVLTLPISPKRVRAVTHLGVSPQEIDQAAAALREAGG
ncbi:L-allo-threonine aldolase [Pirellulimonas nuda]|uniref:L-allo-threonine aldolase n=1 Tax=Pirellulimonas nuda TaxID=2528009 RepID=A0A518DAE5_9BACT|nr:GntG family PLP-dependent aldolase [Pirellulimonas nuda]QDU88455.1 L-allo-threonine aldolase [Pirellulimonas nuda]